MSEKTETGNAPKTNSDILSGDAGNDDVKETPYESPVDFEWLKTINPDIYAWIDIPDTVISYPIVQKSNDRKFYLNHNSDGKRSAEGALYTEYPYNKKDLESPMTVIYGHFMRDGSLFGSLQKYYYDSKFFKVHNIINMYTENGVRTYRIFAAMPYSNIHLLYYYNLASPRVFEAFFVICLDKEGEQRDSGSYRNNAQNDLLLLLVMDAREKKYSLIQINRDTMTNVPVLDVNGMRSGKNFEQIALAHTYGNGLEVSCENTVKAVSDFLGGVNIDNYAAITMSAVAPVNDYFGGVDVTVEEDMKPWTLGNSYDRPIPRRILEEFGIERNAFGQKKYGGGFSFCYDTGKTLAKKMSKEGFASFEKYLSERPKNRSLKHPAHTVKYFFLNIPHIPMKTDSHILLLMKTCALIAVPVWKIALLRNNMTT